MQDDPGAPAPDQEEQPTTPPAPPVGQPPEQVVKVQVELVEPDPDACEACGMALEECTAEDTKAKTEGYEAGQCCPACRHTGRAVAYE